MAKRLSIIERTCTLDAKIYKIVGGRFDVSAVMKGSKNFFLFFHFCSGVPSFLVEIRNMPLSPQARTE
jgi:hypothetical protein